MSMSYSPANHGTPHRLCTSEDARVELVDGEEKLRDLVHLSRNWPLARLTIPLGGQQAN